tara:strand:- start:1333 stop:2439 length:1107 start_codon:yes stop_codon:yes gene_type:complete
MRIEVLEKRENFIKIAKLTLQNSSFFSTMNFSLEQEYYVNKYLNFIATANLPKKTFQILVNEYSSSLNWKKKCFQYVYVRFSVSRYFRKILSHDTVLFPSIFSKYLVLGGNHRLRLFSNELNSTFVILKFNERNNYIINDIKLRNKFQLHYAPKILNFGSDWIEEEYYEGTPLNRLGDNVIINSTLQKIMLNHDKLLIFESVESINKEDYLFKVKKEINLIVNDKRNQSRNGLLVLVNKTFDLLCSSIFLDEIDVSWTHGDFHQANILVKSDSFRVIDWEASERRFYLYDLFILISGLRTGISIEEGVKKFKIDYVKFINKGLIDSNTINLLLMEELRFNINETFSANFYESGSNTNNLCKSILSFLD